MPAAKIVNTISSNAEILKILTEGHNRHEAKYLRVGLNKSAIPV